MWILLLLCLSSVNCEQFQSLYEYYIPNGKIDSGLVANGPEFHLNGRQFVIYSGSFHYFRIVPQYWHQTLQKFKAAGLNTVQFYIPWNLHEPQPGHFDFESFGLNLTKFLIEIKRADMFAIVRPGPYICAEWDFGGLPPWLLNDPKMSIRTSYHGFIEPTRRYYRKVFDILNKFQFTKKGGPIIALQFENEFFSDLVNLINPTKNLDYLRELHRLIVKENNFTELLFTSDPAEEAVKMLAKSLGVLETANLNSHARKMLIELRKRQPNKPAFVSEFWPGWFDSWGDSKHHRYSTKKFEKQISEILFQANGSVNFYMFIGGTNFGFMNGARVVTSYDYDAPLSESGNYTKKYWKTKELYEKLVASGRHPKIKIPEKPPIVGQAQNYGSIRLEEYLEFDQMLTLLKPVVMKEPSFMEYVNGSSGYGFILYRIKIKPFYLLNITGEIRDRAVIMINGVPIDQINDGSSFFELYIKNHSQWFPNPNSYYTLDILVENLGRYNWGILEMNKQRKGINSPILLDQQQPDCLEIFTFDLNKRFMNLTENLRGWKHFDHQSTNYFGPRLYRGNLKLFKVPSDTFMELPSWTHGNAFINEFNLGRYDYEGPQQTLYIPGPLLKSGQNRVHIFELGTNGMELKFLDHPILEKS